MTNFLFFLFLLSCIQYHAQYSTGQLLLLPEVSLSNSSVTCSFREPQHSTENSRIHVLNFILSLLLLLILSVCLSVQHFKACVKLKMEGENVLDTSQQMTTLVAVDRKATKAESV